MCLNPKKLRDGRQVPCGTCSVCRNSKSREWISRFFCEAEAFSYGAFFGTLTYNDKALDGEKNLRKSDFQKYMKRVKRRLGLYNCRLRYSYVGEYGSQHGRPHFHFIICGLTDKKYPDRNERCELKKILSECWTNFMHDSFCDISTIKSPEKAIQYMIYYQDKCEGWYSVNNFETKDQFTRRTGLVAPFMHFSAGIGREYFEKNKDKIFDLGYLEFHGKKFKIPHYFKKKMACCATKDQHIQVFNRLFDYIDETADKQFGDHKILQYFTSRDALSKFPIEKMAEHMSAWNKYRLKKAELRKKYTDKLRLIWISKLIDYSDFDLENSYAFADCLDGKKFFEQFPTFRDFREGFFSRKVFFSSVDSYFREELLLKRQFARQNHINWTWFEQKTNEWNYLLSCIFNLFELTFKQKALNRAEKIRLGQLKRSSKNANNKTHD